MGQIAVANQEPNLLPKELLGMEFGLGYPLMKAEPAYGSGIPTYNQEATKINPQLRCWSSLDVVRHTHMQYPVRRLVSPSYHNSQAASMLFRALAVVLVCIVGLFHVWLQKEARTGW